MKGYNAAVAVLPERIRLDAAAFSEDERRKITEFRLRCGTVPSALFPEGEQCFGKTVVTQQDVQRILEICSGASPYAVQESLRAGFITVRGGVRVGFGGEIIPNGEKVGGIRNFSSAAVRIPREIRGCGEQLCRGDFVSTLLISPPGIGKTTLLRDMVRCLSNAGLRVSLCDERGEVAGLAGGMPGFDLGRQTDVLSGGRKSETAMMLLRCMTPDVVAMDEITAEADVEACQLLCHCGVRLLATAHSSCVEELCMRPLYRQMLARRMFRRAVIIERHQGERCYREESLC